jgi:hypothetical protein
MWTAPLFGSPAEAFKPGLIKSFRKQLNVKVNESVIE